MRSFVCGTELASGAAERTLADRVGALGHVTAFVERVSALTQADADKLDAASCLCPLLPGALPSSALPWALQ